MLAVSPVSASRRSIWRSGRVDPNRPQNYPAYGNTPRAYADRGHVGRLPHVDFGGSLRRHHHWDVFRPDLASLSDGARWGGAGSASRIDSVSRIRTPDRESLAGVRIPSQGERAEGAPTLLGFGGNAWNAQATALTLHALFPHRDVVAFHYRGYAPSTGRPSAQALFSDSLIIFDYLLRTKAGERIIPVGFSIGAAVAAYLARYRPIAGLILITPFDSLEAVARDLYWWAPVAPLLRNRMPTIEFVRGSHAPTALIIAERDTIVPKRRRAPLRTAIRNLVFERTIDAGHNDLYDRPDFAAAAREALARISRFRMKSRVNRARDSMERRRISTPNGAAHRRRATLRDLPGAKPLCRVFRGRSFSIPCHRSPRLPIGGHVRRAGAKPTLTFPYISCLCAVGSFNHLGLSGTQSSTDSTCAIAACRTIRGDGMARRARSCWSFAKIAKPANVRSIFCGGA